MKRDQIKAVVSYDWNDKKRCKHYPGDKVIVVGRNITSMNEQHLMKHSGKRGIVFAVTVTNDGKIRGHNTSYGRAYTKYYVEFEDKACVGLHSHYIKNI